VHAYVLDGSGAPAPIGVAGEIHLGGVGLARGYLHRPALTADRFVPDPFGGSGARLYRTGDVGRWRADGVLEYVGRLDHQIKLRGFRIELGEIEAVLATHPNVAHAVVVARTDLPDDERLVAYYVAEGGAASAELLRAHLRERLPDYMVPSRFVVLEALPVTANGKIDHAALKNPYQTDGEPTGDGPPAPATPPQTTPATPSATTPAMAWADSAVAEAAALGLETALVVRPGRLSPGEALTASARWLERVREMAGDGDPAWEERFSADGLVQLALPARPANPNSTSTGTGTGTPTRTPTADRSPSVSGRTSPAPDADPAVTDVIAAILADLTGSRVEADSTFTALGATSLTLVLTHRRLRESIAPRLALADMFEHATVASLAAHITGLRLPGGTARGETPAVPASPASTRRSSRVAARAHAQEVGR
jgi:pyochelin synthetase